MRSLYAGLWNRLFFSRYFLKVGKLSRRRFSHQRFEIGDQLPGSKGILRSVPVSEIRRLNTAKANRRFDGFYQYRNEPSQGTRLLRFRPDKDAKDCTWREVRPPRREGDPTVDDLLGRG